MPDPIGVADAEHLMKRAKSQLLLNNNHFFAHLAMRMELIVDTNCAYGWTDGNVIAYNPDYVSSLNNELRKSFVARMVLHVALGHLWRRNHRDKAKWEMACVLVVSALMVDSNMPMSPDWPYLKEFDTCSAEEVYRQLPDPPGGNAGGAPGDGEGDWVRDAPQEGKSEEESQIEVLEAIHQANKQGTLPKGLQRLVTTINEPSCRDLVSALLEFVSRRANNDYTYQRPSRRGREQGLYMPSLYSLECPPVVACVDTSGSVDDELLQTYVGALQRVLDECHPEYMVVISCDAAVHKVATFYPGDDIRGPFPGKGGTNFIPAFTEALKHEPTAILYLTDTFGTFPPTAPSMPVLWVVYDKHGSRPVCPFGSMIYIS